MSLTAGARLLNYAIVAPLGQGAALGFGQKKNDLRLEDDFVSRAHARLDRHEGGYQLMDLKRRNGAKVNGHQLKPCTPLPLNNGDQREGGETMWVFEETRGAQTVCV